MLAVFIHSFVARLGRQAQRGTVGGTTLERIVAMTGQHLVACEWEVCEFGRSAFASATGLALLYQGVNLPLMRHRWTCQVTPGYGYKIRQFDLPCTNGILLSEYGKIHMVALLLKFRKDGLETFRSIFVLHFLLSFIRPKTSIKWLYSVTLYIHFHPDLHDMNGRGTSESRHRFVFWCHRQVELLVGKMNTLKFCHNIYKANASLMIVLCLFSQNLLLFPFLHWDASSSFWMLTS